MRWWVVGAALVAVAPAPQADDPLASRTKGRATAPVTVYEMGDFQCPACQSFFLETLPALDSEFVRTGKVRFVFINYPLEQIHPNARSAAELAVCAARQHRFWVMHDLLYRHQTSWAPLDNPRNEFLTLGDSAGLNRTQLVACLAAPATRQEVSQDLERSRASGARSTPSFYIEGGLLQGAAPLDVFRQVLDSIYHVHSSRRE